MICPLPNVSSFSSGDNKAQISLYLDNIKKWRDLSGYPFGTIEFVPDPYIIPFKDEVKSLNSEVLAISVSFSICRAHGILNLYMWNPII